MPTRKFTPEQLEVVRGHIRAKLSSGTIEWLMKKDGIKISSSYIRKLRIQMNSSPAKDRMLQKRGLKFKLNPRRIANLKNFLLKTHPPTLSWLASHFIVSKYTIWRYKGLLKVRKYMKPKKHEITEATRSRRAKRSIGLYMQLNCNKWMNIIASDEVMFYLDGTYGKRDIQYIEEGADKSIVQLMPKRARPKAVMIWIGFGYKGFLKPIFVPPMAKVNSLFYIESILKPMIEEANEKYGERKWTLHQDSAPAHTAKNTRKFLQDQGVKFIPPEKWMPCSPDCSPCDYWLFPLLKSRVKQKSVTSVPQLKRLINSVLNGISLQKIRKALEAWPRRVLKLQTNFK